MACKEDPSFFKTTYYSVIVVEGLWVCPCVWLVYLYCPVCGGSWDCGKWNCGQFVCNRFAFPLLVFDSPVTTFSLWISARNASLRAANKQNMVDFWPSVIILSFSLCFQTFKLHPFLQISTLIIMCTLIHNGNSDDILEHWESLIDSTHTTRKNVFTLAHESYLTSRMIIIHYKHDIGKLAFWWPTSS